MTNLRLSKAVVRINVNQSEVINCREIQYDHIPDVRDEIAGPLRLRVERRFLSWWVGDNRNLTYCASNHEVYNQQVLSKVQYVKGLSYRA